MGKVLEFSGKRRQKKNSEMTEAEKMRERWKHRKEVQEVQEVQEVMEELSRIDFFEMMNNYYLKKEEAELKRKQKLQELKEFEELIHGKHMYLFE